MPGGLPPEIKKLYGLVKNLGERVYKMENQSNGNSSVGVRVGEEVRNVETIYGDMKTERDVDQFTPIKNPSLMTFSTQVGISEAVYAGISAVRSYLEGSPREIPETAATVQGEPYEQEEIMKTGETAQEARDAVKNYMEGCEDDISLSFQDNYGETGSSVNMTFYSEDGSDVTGMTGAAAYEDPGDMEIDIEGEE